MRIDNRTAMDPLDLSIRPPRAPRAEIGGVIFLPRSIDKARATLPGGDIGPYWITGFTGMMLEMLGITSEAFVAAVAAAATDEDVAAFVASHTTPEKIAEWNAFVALRKPRNGDRAAAIELSPWLAERPDLILSLDVLDEDDRQYFAARGAEAR